MNSIVKGSPETRLLLIIVIGMTLLVTAVQIADAPPLEALNPDDIVCYQITNEGLIMDSDGRMRGWLKGEEIYSPDMELRYRVSGRRLEDAP